MGNTTNRGASYKVVVVSGMIYADLWLEGFDNKDSMRGTAVAAASAFASRYIVDGPLTFLKYIGLSSAALEAVVDTGVAYVMAPLAPNISGLYVRVGIADFIDDAIIEQAINPGWEKDKYGGNLLEQILPGMDLEGNFVPSSDTPNSSLLLWLFGKK